MVEQPAPGTVRTISDLLETKARKLGDETLFHYNDTEYSYNTVEENANLIANNLRSRGISKGDIVCIFMYNRPEYLYTLFALAKIGAITAPIDTRFTGDSLVHVLSETETPVVVLDGDTRERYE
jgi:acyl-CoA synthetase (AMP-forming)/AMP-acid ligase II